MGNGHGKDSTLPCYTAAMNSWDSSLGSQSSGSIKKVHARIDLVDWHMDQLGSTLYFPLLVAIEITTTSDT